MSEGTQAPAPTEERIAQLQAKVAALEARVRELEEYVRDSLHRIGPGLKKAIGHNPLLDGGKR